jgi:hypothetical protein
MLVYCTHKKGSPVHIAPACAASGEGSDHFEQEPNILPHISVRDYFLPFSGNILQLLLINRLGADLGHFEIVTVFSIIAIFIMFNPPANMLFFYLTGQK